MVKNPLLSIVIPTKNSSFFLPTLLKSIAKQNRDNVEVIVVDNDSSDNTVNIAHDFKVKYVNCPGKAPQVARQRNIGAKEAKGEYIYFMDSDMELSKGILFYLEKELKKENNAHAWYVPEKIITNSKILSRVRNFEADFIDGTVVSAARIMKKTTFFLLGGYDEGLSGGPSDWDLNNKLIMNDLKIEKLNKGIYHHEENLSLFTYIFKKTKYIRAGERYKEKWKKQDSYIFKQIVRKQYSPYYRLFKIFVEEGKFKKLRFQIIDYVLFVLVKTVLSFNYLVNLFYKKYVK